MSVDGGVRNSTMLLLLMCIPLLVASCQHTFGLSEQTSASEAAEEQESKVVAKNSDLAGKIDVKDTTTDQANLFVSSPVHNAETVSRDIAAVDQDSVESHSAQPAAAPTAEPAKIETASNDAKTVDPETSDPPTTLAGTSNSESADSTRDQTGKEGDDTAVQPEEEIDIQDATAEFEKWSVTLDDEIRQSVLREIMAQLEQATANLDKRQAQLERLHVEAELYRMQIQHLQNRRQEWAPAE